MFKFIKTICLLMFLPITTSQATVVQESRLENDMEKISALSRADNYRKKSRPVGKIIMNFEDNSSQDCTGSLITSNIIITAYHCLVAENTKIMSATLIMGFVDGSTNSEEYKIDIKILHKDAKLDFALLEVSGEPGDKWGTIELSRSVPTRSSSLFIIHHPSGLKKRLTRKNCFVIASGNRAEMHHSCDTKQGSSGAPIFDNNRMQVIGIHTSAKEHQYNISTLIRDISRSSDVILKLAKVSEVAANSKQALAWEFVRKANQKIIYSMFIDQYKSGYFVDLAKKKMKSGSEFQRIGQRQKAIPVHECDRLTAIRYDPDSKADHVEKWEIDSPKAINECKKAIAKYPDTARFEFQLGRAFHKARNFVDAEKQYLKAVSHGSVQALFSVGQLYHNGNHGIVQNYNKAKEYYSIAERYGHSPAIAEIGWMYYFGQGVKKNTFEAMASYKKARQAGFLGADLYIGRIYNDFNEDIKQDYSKARKYYELAAKNNVPRAMYKLGRMYQYGQGVGLSFKKAHKYYLMAAERDDTYGMWKLGSLYENPKTEYFKKKDNFKTARSWYLRSANLSDSEGMRRLGRMAYNGHGIEQNKCKEAQRWYKKAIENNDIDVYNDMALLYIGGRCPSFDSKKGEVFDYLIDGEKKNNHWAVYNLGVITFSGMFNIKKDYEKSLEYFKKSAHLGNTEAMIRVADHYERGFGVKADMVESIAWLKKSAERRNTEAMLKLARIYEGLDSTQSAEWLLESAYYNNKNARRILLKEAMQGWEVDTKAEVQAFLRDKTLFYNGHIDGILGPATRRAILKYFELRKAENE